MFQIKYVNVNETCILSNIEQLWKDSYVHSECYGEEKTLAPARNRTPVPLSSSPWPGFYTYWAMWNKLGVKDSLQNFLLLIEHLTEKKFWTKNDDFME
jgi:hypothetical protein